MTEDIEVPRRGYDTKDVEAMNRALYKAEGGGHARRNTVFVVLLAVVIAAAWLIAGR